eukprot:1159252-Pelagomonas_calceolata.AAC.1
MATHPLQLLPHLSAQPQFPDMHTYPQQLLPLRQLSLGPGQLLPQAGHHGQHQLLCLRVPRPCSDQCRIVQCQHMLADTP